MKAKCINPENTDLVAGQEYEVVEAYIYGYHAKVKIRGKNGYYSSRLFDESFQRKLHEAIDFFNKKANKDCYQFGIFNKCYN